MCTFQNSIDSQSLKQWLVSTIRLWGFDFNEGFLIHQPSQRLLVRRMGEIFSTVEVLAHRFFSCSQSLGLKKCPQERNIRGLVSISQLAILGMCPLQSLIKSFVDRGKDF